MGKTTVTAIVSDAPQPDLNWSLKDVIPREINDDELLVEMVATGVCHTDLVMGSLPAEYQSYPCILGHEGAGYVRKIGSNVTVAKVGDPVILSFTSCSECKLCKCNLPSYCQSFASVNIANGAGAFRDISGTPISGTFFGQSSFSNWAPVKANSIVNVLGLVTDKEELKLFAPLGCGFQTGSATITNLGKAKEGDSVAIMGLGGVGLAAIMAAKLKKCGVIIGVDRVQGRLGLAKTLGATHTIDTSVKGIDIAAEIKAITGGEGVDIAMDTTGVPELIQAGLLFTANCGKMILTGISPMGAELSINPSTFMASGVSLLGSTEGGIVPSAYIPEMIAWYRDGKFPIEKIVKFFSVRKFEIAIDEMRQGITVKPVLVW